MDMRRDKSKLSTNRRESTDLFTDAPVSTSLLGATTRPISTPVRLNNPSEDEDSPYFPCSTQEMNEDVDVLWDWNSPQSKPKTSIQRKSKRRLNMQQHSPKVPLRRHPSNNEQIKQDFNKLREELRALKAEIAKPDHEDSLVLSPREEEAFKKEETIDDFDHGMMIEEDPPENFEDDFQDPFDDDMDDHLVLCSQQIDMEVHTNKNNFATKQLNTGKTNLWNTKDNSKCSTANSSANSYNTNHQRDNFKGSITTHIPNLPKTSISKTDNGENRHSSIRTEHLGQNIRHSTTRTEHLGQKSLFETDISITQFQHSFLDNTTTTNKKQDQVKSLHDSDVFNDSFDNVLSQIIDEDEEFDQLTQVVDIKQYRNGNTSNNVDEKTNVFPRSQSEDIIVAEPVQASSRKVEWHRTQSFESYNAQLSKEKLEEIERKRLEAKAKRDAKKKQEVVMPVITESTDTSPLKCSQDEIEKKRRQALEKLEAKRLQDIIEKKKQEALKRREENRKRNACNVKSSLATRL